MHRHFFALSNSRTLSPTGKSARQRIRAAGQHFYRLLAVLGLTSTSSCNIDVNLPPPDLRFGGTVEETYASIEPVNRAVNQALGDIAIYEFRLYDRFKGRYAEVSDVTWSNEAPEVVRLVSPVEGCGARCAQITALASGAARVRAFTIVPSGKRVEGELVLFF
jgi:hypothetical protein